MFEINDFDMNRLSGMVKSYILLVSLQIPLLHIL